MRLILGELTQYRKQPGRDEVRYNCPFCHDARGKLYVNKRTGKYHCFHCGVSGVCRVDFEVETAPTAQAELPAIELSDRIEPRHHDYLKERHIDPSFAQAFGVRSGRKAVAGRLIFPSQYYTPRQSFDERPVLRTLFRSAHGIRDWSPGPKSVHYGDVVPMTVYTGNFWPHGDSRMTSPNKPTRLFYPDVESCEQFMRIYAGVIVEGAADALRLGQLIGNQVAVVCLFGQHLSETNARFLARVMKHFVIWFDKPGGTLRAGVESMKAIRVARALETLAHGDVRIHKWAESAEEGADPASLGEQAMEYELKRLYRGELPELPGM